MEREGKNVLADLYFSEKGLSPDHVLQLQCAMVEQKHRSRGVEEPSTIRSHFVILRIRMNTHTEVSNEAQSSRWQAEKRTH